MKKWFMLFICMILLVGTVSAFEFDNVKSYDSVKKEVAITNAFGLGNDLFKGKLITEQNLPVVRGKDRLVGAFQIQYFNSEGYTLKEIIKNVELLDLKKLTKKKTPFTLKYLETTEETISYKECLNYECSEYNLKTRTNIKKSWLPVLDEKDLFTNVTLGIFTNVYPNENGDWIPEFYGVKVPEWATWNETFESSLVSVYNFEESSGDLLDVFNSDDNGTLSGTPTRQQTGINNFAYDFDGTDDKADITSDTDFANPQSLTLSAWVNFDVTTGSPRILEKGVYGNHFGYYEMQGYTTNNKILCQRADESGEIQYSYSSVNSISTTGWYHIVCVFSADGNSVNTYINGVLDNDGTFGFGGGYTYSTNTEDLSIGGTNAGGSYLNGKIDEVYIWNEEKDTSFIQSLYDSGAGTFYNSNKNPEVSLINPINNSKYISTPQTIEFNCNATDDVEVSNLTLKINGVVNYTETGIGTDNLNLSKNLTFSSEGDYNWSCLAYDNEATSGESEIWAFGIDTSNPLLDSHNISNVITLSGFPANLSWWFNATDTHIDSCWYYSSENSTNVSTTCNGEIINTPWYSEGTKTLYYCANDTFGNEQCNSTSLFVYGITLTQLESQDPIGEGDSVTYTFWVNLTDLDSDWAETNATLRLNNTDYSPNKYAYSDAMKFVYTKQFTNESGAVAGAIHHWNWTYNIQNSSYILSSGTTETSNTTVYSVAIDDCSAYGTKILNYTLYDEEYKSNSLPIALANQSIEIDVTLTKGSYNWEYSKKETNTNTADICVPNNLLNSSNYLLDVIARYKADYHVVEFNYIVDYNLTNNSLPQHIHLYDLYSQTDRSEYSTSFLVNYQDENYLPVQDAIIDLWRYYVGDGEFLSVEHGKTDADGNTRLHFVTEDVRYKAYVRVDGELVYTSPEFLALCQATPCQINLQKESGVTAVGNYSQVENLAYTVSLDKSTKTVTLSYSTVDGSSANLNLNVTKFNAYGNDTVCTDSASSSGGTLSCTVPASATNTTYLVEIWKDGDSLPTYVFDLKPDAYETFGYTGVIMTGMLYLTLVLMAVSSGGIAVLVFGFLGLVVATMLTLFSGGSIIGVGSSLMWLVVAIIIVAIKIANRRGG